MRLLLDSHTFLWWIADDRRLSVRAGAALDDAGNELFFSTIAGYEISYKQHAGKLPAISGGLPRRLQQAGVQVLSLSLDHALAAAALPGPHRDPWDRIMMAQAQIEGLTVVTVDPVFSRYQVSVLW
ncbi:MAG TPA: type II toxin-antitoxin system VapC family toxin [Stellaceae bacterium]|nr:type II toxin-antitoxin system VapC family toxin [Stellaceae bacterium]